VYVPETQDAVPPATNVLVYVPLAPDPVARDSAVATVLPEGFATLMVTAVPETAPEAAVTEPETVKLWDPVMELGETPTVTESAAAKAVVGARMRNARSIPAGIAVLRFIGITDNYIENDVVVVVEMATPVEVVAKTDAV